MRSTDLGYHHGEAFMLMWYACPCGHQERIWNSRDGVTPFALRCPSCGNLDLLHVDWQRDWFAPQHVPHEGQRYFRDGTPSEAAAIKARRIKAMREAGCISAETADGMVRAAREGRDDEFPPGWPKLDQRIGDYVRIDHDEESGPTPKF